MVNFVELRGHVMCLPFPVRRLGWWWFESKPEHPDQTRYSPKYCRTRLSAVADRLMEATLLA